MDNARFHKSQSVTENIKKSNNTIIFSLAYNPSLNPIENFFSQLKNYVRSKSPDSYEDLKNQIHKIIIKKIKKHHINNYFNYLFLQAKKFVENNTI